jgi:glycine cleavage system aminomethyltransferase T
MSVSDPGARAGSSRFLDQLGGLQADAGAVLAPYRGGTIAISYGSAAGELAACMNAVGIASRTELTKLELTAPGPSLDRVIDGLLGMTLLAGGIHLSRAVGWYRFDDRRLVALCEPDHGERLRGRLEFWTLRDPAVKLYDRTDEWTTIAVLGHRATQVLGELGVYGPGRNPRTVPPVTRTANDPQTSWLLHADDYALAIVPRRSAAALWRQVTTAGRPWLICAVGREALVRYQMLTRLGH